MPSTIPLVAPVRFSGGGLTLQTTISRIGAEGLFVRSLVSPKEGAELRLVLSLPGTARPLELRGKVGPRPAEAGKDAGFFLVFGQLPEDARAFIDVLLRSRGMAGLSRPGVPKPPPPAAPPAPPAATPAPRADDGRAYPRVQARLRVGWTSSRDFLTAWSENISRGGIFIATDDPPELREIVELSVELPDGRPAVKTHAEVVHRVTPEQARRTGMVAGAGLQFLDADDDFRARLDACIQALSD